MYESVLPFHQGLRNIRSQCYLNVNHLLKLAQKGALEG